MKKNYIKIVLDLFMFLFVILFYNKHTINISFHEIGGLIICLVFLIHIGINSRWIYSVSKRLFNKDLPAKTKIGYVINFLLLISFILIFISGIMISKTIFTSISGNRFLWKNIHYFSAGISIILLGIHIGLHIPFIKGMSKKIIPIPQKISIVILTMFIAIILTFGSYSIVSSNFLDFVTTPFIETQSNHNGRNQGEHKNLVNKINANKLINKNNNHQINFNNIFIQGATYGSIILTIAFITGSTEKITRQKI